MNPQHQPQCVSSRRVKAPCPCCTIDFICLPLSTWSESVACATAWEAVQWGFPPKGQGGNSYKDVQEGVTS